MVLPRFWAPWPLLSSDPYDRLEAGLEKAVIFSEDPLLIS
jgi:hypothetical protein